MEQTEIKTFTMKGQNGCNKCDGLAVTLGWSALPQVTEIGSGEIAATASADRIFYREFYPEGDLNETLPAWPVCPKCSKRLPPDLTGKTSTVKDQGASILWAFGLVVLLFLALLIAYLFY